MNLSAIFQRIRARGEPDAWAFWLSYLVLLPLYWAPLRATALLPGLDLPFHLSIADMLSKGGTPGSPYAAFYEARPGLAPYALHYLLLVALGKAVSLTLAHKLVIAAYVAALPASAALLLGACGRSRVPALLAFPLAYNLTLHYGFVSFALSLPVLLFMLWQLSGFLLAWEIRPGRWLGAALLALLLFLCHLQNFLYGVGAALVFIALSGAPWRHRVYGVAALLPCVAALVYWQATSEFADDPGQQRKTLAFAWMALKSSRVFDLQGGMQPLSADLWVRIEGIAVHILRGFADMVDVRAAQVLIWLALAYALAGALMRRPAPGARPRMGLAGLVTFLAALAAYLLLPHHLPVFELQTFYPRFAALVALMLLLLIPGRLKGGAAFSALLPVPALVLGVLYGRALTRHYESYGKEVQDFVTVAGKADPGGRAVGVVFDRSSGVMRIESALVGLASLYPALRPAPQSMVPVHYCGMRHMPCRPRVASSRPPYLDVWYPANLRPDQLLPFFDYFFVRRPPPKYDLFGPRKAEVELVAQSGTWMLFKRRAFRPPAART